MKELNTFVENINTRRALFGEEPIEITNKWFILDVIYDMLSPENLFADGERSREDAMARKAHLENLKKELLEQGG